ncbi:MAG: hypothetical protein RLZZ22_735 [Pseudomonadota bacterium]
MNPLLEQFLSEARDLLQEIAHKLLQLEDAPADAELLGGLFRRVHTLKGNSGLFEFGPLTRVVHAAEDLLDQVRDGHLRLDMALTDDLLEAMDFVGRLLDIIERQGELLGDFEAEQQALVTRLRARLPAVEPAVEPAASGESGDTAPALAPPTDWLWLAALPEAERAQLLADLCAVQGPAARLMALRYVPEPECFFKGEDPLLTLKTLPGLRAFTLAPRQPWPPVASLDIYQTNLVLDALSDASPEALAGHLRYVPEQVALYPLPAWALAWPSPSRPCSRWSTRGSGWRRPCAGSSACSRPGCPTR